MGEAMGIIERYISTECLQLLAQSMSGEEVVRGLIATLSVSYQH
jgi:hypothetical protein